MSSIALRAFNSVVLAVALVLSLATWAGAQSSPPNDPAAVTQQAPTPPSPPIPQQPATAPEAFRAAKSWGYQLTNTDVARLAASPFDVLVIDYSRDGSEAQALKPADLERLKKKPDGKRRVVLSYLSIGEAEDYRYYWNPSWNNFWFIPNFWSAPSWLGKQNSDWGGNYAVRYWDPGWQTIILGDGGYLDRIVKAGFDGVWLDKVDSSLEDISQGNANAKSDMIAFIGKIGERGRAQRPGFLIVPQNGEDLLADQKLLPLIDGYGKESLIYGEDGAQKPNSPEFIARKMALLSTVKAAGKTVLAVEYLFDPAAVASAEQKIAAAGFVPLNAIRELDAYPGETKSGTAIASSEGRGRGKGRGIGLIGSPWTWLGLGVGLLVLMLLGARMGKKRM